MCGIAGVYNGKSDEVCAMLDRIQHRGPDGMGIHENGEAIHGHVRLSLVDLSSASDQPFVIGNATLTFNGEIWNYRELKANISEKFISTGDTEVLARLLMRDGLQCLNKLDGMFAFAFSDGKGGHYLVRDMFGKVPLYISKTKTGYVWASERKAFPKGHTPISVPSGHVFNLVTGEWVKWYELPDTGDLSESELHEKLNNGVAKRLHADADVCCLISGGLDSSIILALAQQHSHSVTAFTAVRDPRSEDLLAARRLCSDFDIELIEVNVEVNKIEMTKAMQAIEVASKAQIEIAVLCLPLAERIKAEGFKACLSGEAADELFGGYGNFCIQASKVDDEGVKRLRRQQLEKMSRGNFIRCNKAFMAKGVECRLPFMEQSLVENAINLGKAQSPTGKKLLKNAFKDLVPSWVIKRTKDTFQGGSGVSNEVAELISSPIKYYNAELKKQFGYLPKD